MKVNWIRSIAYGLGFAGIAAMPQAGFAQSGQYTAPSGWNNFHPQSSGPTYPTTNQPVDPASPQYRTAAVPPQYTQLPPSAGANPYAPAPQANYSMPPSLAAGQPSASHPPAASQPTYSVARRTAGGAMIDGSPHHDYGHPQPAGGHGGHGGSGSIVEQYSSPAPHGSPYVPSTSPYIQAASSPWEAGSCGPAGCGPGYGGDVRPPLAPWFGGANLLYWTMANDSFDRILVNDAMPSETLLSTGQVDPDYHLGYELFFGKYLAGGKYAISASYLHFDPDSERARYSVPTDAGGVPLLDPRNGIAAFDHIGFYRGTGYTDPAAPFESMNDVYNNMEHFEIGRDVSFQGIELSMWSFGFGGARRLAPAYGTGLGDCPGQGNSCHGYGGFGGPLERPCSGTTQVAFMHGFRWFQFEDDFYYSAWDNSVPPYSVRFDSNATNDLLGYQIGGRWNYVATCRLNLSLAAKFGVFANNVKVEQEIGDAGMPARYISTDVSERTYVSQRDRDTVLSTLGEIDLGLGYRLCDAWTVRGGYRVLGASGVATSLGMIKHEMFSENLRASKEANNSVILHGVYMGAEYNW